MARAKQAHDEVIGAVYRAQAAALQIESRAKIRLADEFDAAQERNEVQRHGGDRSKIAGQNLAPASPGDLGLTAKEIHDARKLRDVEQENPGLIARALERRVRPQPPPKILRRVRLTIPLLRGPTQG